jgi:hypothetical protein
VLLVTSALRPSETVGLSWPAVDLEAGMTVDLPEARQGWEAAVLVDSTKTDGSASIVVLDPVAVTMLRA